MWPNTALTKLLKIDYPIIQAPMAGCTTPELVAAVSNAGGLGSLGAALMPPEKIREAIQAIRELTDKPFAVNLFTPMREQKVSAEDIAEINLSLAEIRHALKLPENKAVHPIPLLFAEQLEVLIVEKVPAFSFTFGILPKAMITKIKRQNILVMGTATTVHEAKLLETSGVDAIVAQGYEAGGHRGSADDTEIENAFIGSMALIPQIVDHVKIPVIASGGIMDGRGVVAALVLGAAGVQMGTAFLTCPESGIHPKYREALLNSTDESTRLTKVFTGRYARGIKNRFMLEMGKHALNYPGYAMQSGMTLDIRQAAAKQDNPDYMTLWSGQAAGMCKRAKPAAKVMAEIIKQVKEIYAKD